MRSSALLRNRRLRAALVGLAAPLALAALVAAAPDATAVRWREAVADAVLLAFPPSAPEGPGSVVVVEVDDASLDRVGPWPWPRETLADLVEAIAAGVPRAIGLDVVLAGPDRASPVTLAARLAERANAADVAAAVRALPDPDQRLAVALSAAPTVLGFLLAEGPDPALPPAPLVIAGDASPLSIWGTAGAVAPLPAFAAEAAGVGASSMAEDADGLVRRVPLLVGVAGAVQPGLAAELARQAESAGSFILDAKAGTLGIGPRAVPLDAAADLRVRPSTPAHAAARTVPAAAVLAGEIDAARFEDRVVLIGGGAAALGALRATAAGPVTPSVQIQADSLETLASGRIPFRPAAAMEIEIAGGAVLALVGAALGATLGPGIAAALTLAAVAGWSGGAVAAIAVADRILDPVTPALAGLLALVAAGTAAAVETRRSAARIRRRFEQHLAPSVVARIVERPDLLKLEGERREVTALFTDIENFTAVTDRIGPVELVRLLDRYFQGVSEIVVAHGGMIDKIVGDAVHALFNAPLDLPDHPRRALDAARAILAFSRAFAAEPDVVAAGLGRTRIGIETGDVVVGDVGAGAKLDYTAHGSAVNTAARLEAMNKTFGSSICVGPMFRARLPDVAFRRLGEIEVRGRGKLELFEPADAA